VNCSLDGSLTICRAMKCSLATILFGVSMISMQAQTVVVEPDDYANGTVLNTASPYVSLTTAGSNNLPIPPRSFDILATTSTKPWQPPTGNNVFSAAGVPFFPSTGRLRMDFNGLVSSLSIAFQGGNTLSVERGRLDVFGSNGSLLSSYETQDLLGGQTEIMSITRGSADIAWATAYSVPEADPFGRLDALSFSMPIAVPEPGAMSFVAMAAGGFLWRCLQRRRAALSSHAWKGFILPGVTV
jgi:hypothetical protein